MKYSVETTKRFEKDLKRCVKRGLPLDAIETVIDFLQDTGTLGANTSIETLNQKNEGIS